MRLGDERPNGNIEDPRGQGGMGEGLGFPRSGANHLSGGRGMGLRTLIILIIAYFAIKSIFGINLLDILSGGSGGSLPQEQGQSQILAPGQSGIEQAKVTDNSAHDFVARVFNSTDRVWAGEFKKMNMQYHQPKLVVFENTVQSACGRSESGMGPFYCPRDATVYIDNSWNNDKKDGFGSLGGFAQAYIVAHEVAHYVQKLDGIARRMMQQRTDVPDAEATAMSVMMELQADCFAGVWARKAKEVLNIIEEGDVEGGLKAAAAIGDGRLQKHSQGYVVPEAFTHGTSEQRSRWFKRGMDAGDVSSCDTFGAQQL